MTIPLLPDTDLARLGPLSDDMKRSALRQMKGTFSTFSYKHVRSVFNDIFNVQLGMFGPVSATPWAALEAQLTKTCKPGAELRNNLQIGKALHNYATSMNIKGRHHDFFPMPMGVGKKVSFWLPMVLALDSKPYVIFIDPRRSKGLTQLGRRFAFSMMHERIRAADEDFADINLGIIRFEDDDEGGRSVRFFSDEGIDLYSLDELESMVASTYRIWQEVYEERAAEVRRKGTGTGGLF
ncbi:type VI toxin-antitoxin system SocB family DNA replication inhibitor toxin [Neorhizobium galegae]|uniref:type VI toxin-antitoxin system SocB family DNA replication inhibitor toxin n=1 Tax=Neorhizobium galegae TaxID=399 RepID=UPI002104E2AB|nr:hypothetical protein [Neorhizobium galegae]MCQ1834855.1 hypothetical protein [Neorhizobium galegae]UIY29689.1 hypothetical protein LZK73_01900 [Neorhizobium galegae]